MLLTLVPDLNIAPLKYAHVHKDHGGPLAAVSFRERDGFFEGFASLDLERTGFQNDKKFLYGEHHGTGTAATKAEAIYCAISEALERWAWQAAFKDPALREKLRYDLDPSTTGFAAFPGLGFHGARKRAFFEAAERWSLCSWWEGKLGHFPLTVSGALGIRITTPVPGVSVVVLWQKNGDLVSYGFAASYSVAAATAKAQIELQRNHEVLAFYASSKESVPFLNLTERRLVHFASPSGHAEFMSRVGASGGTLPVPKLIVDLVVPGPWSQYAHVWRCLFEGDRFRENDKDNYFLF